MVKILTFMIDVHLKILISKISSSSKNIILLTLTPPIASIAS